MEGRPELRLSLAFYKRACQTRKFCTISDILTLSPNYVAFVMARYIRAFNVTSIVNCNLLRRRWRFEIIALYPKLDVITEVKCVFVRRKQRNQKSATIGSALYIRFLERFPNTKSELWLFQHYFVSFSYKVLSFFSKLCAF